MKAVQQIYSDESDKAIEKIFYDIDTNESGYLEFHEFENAFTKMKKTPVIWSVQINNFVILNDPAFFLFLLPTNMTIVRGSK